MTRYFSIMFCISYELIVDMDSMVDIFTALTFEVGYKLHFHFHRCNMIHIKHITTFTVYWQTSLYPNVSAL